MSKPFKKWNTDKFYKGWIRMYVVSGFVFAVLAFCNGINAWLIASHDHGSPWAAISAIALVFCLYQIYTVPSGIRDVRRRWIRMIELEAGLVKSEKKFQETFNKPESSES